MRALFSVMILMCAALILAGGTNFAQDKAEPRGCRPQGDDHLRKCDLKLEKKCWTGDRRQGQG